MRLLFQHRVHIRSRHRRVLRLELTTRFTPDGCLTAWLSRQRNRRIWSFIKLVFKKRAVLLESWTPDSRKAIPGVTDAAIAALMWPCGPLYMWRLQKTCWPPGNWTPDSRKAIPGGPNAAIAALKWPCGPLFIWRLRRQVLSRLRRDKLVQMHDKRIRIVTPGASFYPPPFPLSC